MLLSHVRRAVDSQIDETQAYTTAAHASSEADITFTEKLSSYHKPHYRVK